MAITLGIFGVAFAACCVWLGVRIHNRRERWAKKLAAGMLAMMAAYIFSFGPAVFSVILLGEPDEAVDVLKSAYSPIFSIIERGPEPFRTILWYYGVESERFAHRVR